MTSFEPITIPPFYCSAPSSLSTSSPLQLTSTSISIKTISSSNTVIGSNSNRLYLEKYSPLNAIIAPSSKVEKSNETKEQKEQIYGLLSIWATPFTHHTLCATQNHAYSIILKLKTFTTATTTAIIAITITIITAFLFLSSPSLHHQFFFED